MKKCKSRLNVYVEKSVDREKAVVETISCPFYENGNCKVDGLLELYTRVFFHKLKVYEEKNGKLEEMKKPILKPILRKDWSELLRS
jgi:pyruvate/2-oxoacid:ferredoxin oxidoreductase beta subunit